MFDTVADRLVQTLKVIQMLTNIVINLDMSVREIYYAVIVLKLVPTSQQKTV